MKCCVEYELLTEKQKQAAPTAVYCCFHILTKMRFLTYFQPCADKFEDCLPGKEKKNLKIRRNLAVSERCNVKNNIFVVQLVSCGQSIDFAELYHC